MNYSLRKIAVGIGFGLLGISMYWSQDGFNFDLAGDSGYKSMAIFIAWFLAITVSVLEFVFSSQFKDLNPSLILFGVVAYVYSIYTNHGGIIHFQGTATNQFGAWILAIIMDAVPEPLIAWGLYESRAGDFVGNLIKSVFSSPDKATEQYKQHQQNPNQTKKQPPYKPTFPSVDFPRYVGKDVKKGMGREELYKKFQKSVSKPHDSEHPWFGE